MFGPVSVEMSSVKKLQMLGIGAKLISFIYEFLSGCTTSVKIAGKMNSLDEITSGFPQGSMLGPDLFLIYVNSIANSVDCCWKDLLDDFNCISIFFAVLVG